MPRTTKNPDNHPTATPLLVLRDVAKGIDFYKAAFGAEEEFRMAGPDGKKTQHARIRIGNSPIMLGAEGGPMNTKSPLALGGTAVSLYLYVEDVDATFAQAKKSGAQVVQPVDDMFWGDRYGKVLDPFGHEWGLATHKEDLSPEQMGERAKKFFAAQAVAK
jgi:uncharacterized glyoxalase superfamily protein PhnB